MSSHRGKRSTIIFFMLRIEARIHFSSWNPNKPPVIDAVHRKTEPRLWFITTLRFARYGDRSSEPAETRSLLLEPLLVVWGTVAHLSLKRRWCSQVKKLLTWATPALQRPIFRKYIDLFIAHNRTLTLNWPFNWLGAWEFWNLPLFLLRPTCSLLEPLRRLWHLLACTPRGTPVYRLRGTPYALGKRDASSSCLPVG